MLWYSGAVINQVGVWQFSAKSELMNSPEVCMSKWHVVECTSVMADDLLFNNLTNEDDEGLCS